MKFADSIDEYMIEMRRQGRINSTNSDLAYRRVLNRHCDDVGNRDPAKTGRADVKRTLGHWPHPNSQRQAHAVLVSFYDYLVEEGVRDTSPARMVRRARPREVSVFRPTREETVRLMDATEGAQASRRRERWVIHLGVLAGIRREEMRLLQGRHFQREGFIWISKDIGKRGKERWIPVLPELRSIVDEIRLLITEPDQYLFPRRRTRKQEFHGGPLDNSEQTDVPGQAMSAEGLFKLVRRVGRRAGLGAEIGPHTLRHAFGDHVARYAGLRAAQAMLGHANVATTEGSYTGRVSLDELLVAVHGFTYRREPGEVPTGGPGASLSDHTDPDNPRSAPNAR